VGVTATFVVGPGTLSLKGLTSIDRVTRGGDSGAPALDVQGNMLGFVVDDKLYASFKKLDKGGTGGGAKPPAEKPADTPPAGAVPAGKDTKPKPGGGI
jgi:hypothetical protein